MTEIAAEADLSRAWLYKNFPDKASLIVATLVQTDEAFWAEAHSRVSRCHGIAAQVAEAVIWEIYPLRGMYSHIFPSVNLFVPLLQNF